MSTVGVHELIVGPHEHGRGEVGVLRAVLHEVRTEDEVRDPEIRCATCTKWVSSRRVVRAPRARTIQGTFEMRTDVGFCSAACAFRWIMTEDRDDVLNKVGWMLCVAQREGWLTDPLFCGRPPISPHRLELSIFGGDLSEREFAAQSRLPDLVTSIRFAPYLMVDTDAHVLVKPTVTTTDLCCPGGSFDDEEEGNADDGDDPEEGSVSAPWHGLFEEIVQTLYGT